ncbi:MAG: hypothetical protein HYY36_06280, partial [Gammaproteobacteria bacterium]|nr:hypothetical protein [Gammaproteobacteria bacterium]
MLPAINSLWFWGVGELPAPAAAEWSAVYAGDLFTRGLGRLARIPVNSVPGGAEPLAATAAGADRVLVILDDCSRAA